MMHKYYVNIFLVLFLSIIWSGFNSVLAQAPNITYTPPPTYFVNTAIAPLVPNNGGGPVPATVYGQVSTLAGSGTLGYVNNTGTNAEFNIPYTAVGDASGNLYVADASNNAIRKVTTAGVVN